MLPPHKLADIEEAVTRSLASRSQERWMARAAVMERRLAGTTSEDDRLNYPHYFTSDEETDDQVIESLEKAVGSTT